MPKDTRERLGIELGDRLLVRDASALTLETGVGHDVGHSAAMRSRGLKTVVTEDVNHWKKMGGDHPAPGILRPDVTPRLVSLAQPAAVRP